MELKKLIEDNLRIPVIETFSPIIPPCTTWYLVTDEAGIYGDGCEEETEAVSYTHLDVYKRQDLDSNGFTEKFQQGEKQDPYDRKRPVADLYNTMNTGYQKIIKQMTDLLPEKDRDKDELLDFLGGDRG